jgi:hypothetical protein
MNNLIEEDEPEISPIEKPKRVMNQKTRDALALGRQRKALEKALDKTPKSIAEPILKKKALSKAEDSPIEIPKATPKRKQKQVIVIQSDDDDDDDAPQIIIRTKSSKKADLPPPPPIPKVIEKVIEPEPEPIKYRMRRV